MLYNVDYSISIAHTNVGIFEMVCLLSYSLLSAKRWCIKVNKTEKSFSNVFLY